MHKERENCTYFCDFPPQNKCRKNLIRRMKNERKKERKIKINPTETFNWNKNESNHRHYHRHHFNMWKWLHSIFIYVDT